MKERELSQKALDILLKSQRDEETDCLIYDFMAKKEKDPKNKKILAKMAADERDHAKMWKSLTKKEVNPNLKLVYWYKFLTIIMGFTFVLKLIQSGETTASSKYADIIDEVPEAKKASEDELRHEYELIEMLDEMMKENDEAELISVYYGEDVTEEDAEAVVAKIEEKYPDTDVELQPGGQPIYYYLVSVE